MEVERKDLRVSKRGYIISIVIMAVVLLIWASCDRLFDVKKEDNRNGPDVMVAHYSLVVDANECQSSR
jgi:hypothetical protein